MTASGITESQLQLAAAAVGVRADVNTLSGTGRYHRVKLYPVVPQDCYTKGGNRRKGERGDAPYQRESVGYGTAGRRVHAVCWHGFRDYFRACFALAPNATFRTAVDTWKGSADFEARYQDSGYRNIGSAFSPASHAEACRCPESGRAA